MRNNLKKPLNIIFAGNFLYPQGLAATKRVQHFIDRVSRVEGVSAKVLLFRQAHPGRNDARLQGVHQGILYKTIGANITFGWKLPWSIFSYIFNSTSFILNNRKNGFNNVLYLYNEPNIENVLFVIFARLIGYRVIIDVVEDCYLITANASLLSRLKSLSVQFSSRRILWFADAIITISPFLKRKYLSTVGEKIPVFFVPVSAETEKINCSDSGFHQPVRIFYSGSFGEKDGVEILIASFERLCRQYSNVELLLAGKGMEDRITCILEMIDKSPFKDKMHYLGFLSDENYFNVLSNCDIPCMVRVNTDFANRGFPFKLGEYLATGRPVVVSKIGDIVDYLIDMENAYFVEPGSVESIFECLDYILLHEGEALAVGRAGRLIAEEYFSSKINSGMFLSAILHLTHN